MTYKLNASVFDRIVSPIVLVIDGTRKEYENGKMAASDVFEKRYAIESMKAVGDVVEVNLVEVERFPADAGDANLFDGV